MRKRLYLPKLIGLLALSFAVVEPVSGQIGLEEVTRLRFQGNRQFSNESLASAIMTRETECRSFIFLPFCLAGADFSQDPYFLSDRELRQDHARVRLYYYWRGFREAQVDTLLTRSSEGEVELTFRVQEGEPIRVTDVEFRIPEELPDSSILENLPVQVGGPLSLVALDATRDTLETRFRNQGYAHVAVLRNYDIDAGAPYEAEVVFDIWSGPLTRFGPLTIEVRASGGREPTMDEAVVRRMLPFKEGDVFQEDLQFAGQRNLYNLDIFRSVGFETVPDSLLAVDSILPLTISLEEDDVHKVRTGGGLSTAECFNFEANWNSRNFFGGARRLRITGRIANVLTPQLQNSLLCRQAGEGEEGDLTGSISADFTQPWFFSPRNSISASVFVERQAVADIFVREAVGMNLGLNRAVTTSTLLGFSYSPELARLTAAEVIFCSTYLICAPEEIAVLQSAQRLSPVGVTVSQDRRNQALNPTRGYSVVLDLEHADDWTGSEFKYTRLLSEATWYTQGRTQWVLGTRLRGGWVLPQGFKGLGQGDNSSEIVHPEKRLFAGGSNSVRGFSQNHLGPQVLYVEDVKALIVGENSPCTAAQVEDLPCDAGGLSDEKFTPSPTGGTRLLEGSLEVRFPISGRLWEGATFLDFGQVWDEDATPSLSDLEFTPGMGVRYFSPIGPIRVDLGYRFGDGDELAVVTKKIVVNPLSPDGFDTLDDLVVLANPVLWGEGLGAWDLRRFQLHLSIGQAF
jgi:outer membrane protein insertion porin family